MAHLDFKITSWKRLQIPDDKIEEVIEKLKAGDAETPYDLLEEDGIYFNPGGPDEESEETMTVEQNDEWKDWGQKYLIKELKMNKKYAETQMGMISLMWGLKFSNFDK